MRRTHFFPAITLCAATLLQSAVGQTPPTFWSWASRPVMGWNSWDFYGTSINEERTKAQTDYLSTNLLSHGWNLITVDIQWYQPTATGFDYINGATLTMDAYGRLMPATNRFPSATGGLGFKPLADYVHSKGLKFGIHLMRGIPRQAVSQNTPVIGTTNTAAQIADTSSICPWNPDMFGVDMTKPGAQEYYDSIMTLVASWGVDFIKIDDLSKPYHSAEIEGIRKAIDKSGRAIVFSTSPGATPVGVGAHVMRNANQWRISDDFWDNWTALYEQFQRLHDWTPYRGAGHFPDADMLPLGKVQGGATNATGRTTYFTTDEQYTLMSLWAIARSPLILGADMTQMDSATLSLLTNDEVIAVNQYSLHNRQLFRTNDLIAWVADAENSTNKYLAVFNATSSSATVPVNLSSMGYTGSCRIRSLWGQASLGNVFGTFSPTLAAHRGVLYRISGAFIPTPWITSAIAGSNRVMLVWENITNASSYSIKRATSEAGTYSIIATGITCTNFTDVTAQNGTNYFYVVSAIIGGQESPNSGARSATPVGAPGIVSWNYDRYGTIPSTGMAGVQPAANWNNSWPNDPTVNLVDNTGAPTTVDIVYNSLNTWTIQNSHPGVDSNGNYNKELLNGYLNSGAGQISAASSIIITQIPFSYYDLCVYFSSDAAGRPGTITDGTTTYSFSTIGSPSIAGANAVLVRTTDTGTGYPSADYAVFSGIFGSSKEIICNVPLWGGIAGFQIVPRTDPLPTVALLVAKNSSGGIITLSWPTGIGSVVLQKSFDLLNWVAADPQLTTNSISISVSVSNQFFRLARPQS
ncbi:MAG TPA: glycoside hydrolase family 27 protein [Candidatus Paceibacterota bacterium]|nr:glycoside hydrolase family 27 protein [Candidatus Paceibacterota bacterium]